MSLRTSINWLITLVMLLFIASLALLQIHAARRATAAEMEAGTRVTTQLLENLVATLAPAPGESAPAALARVLQQAGRIRAHDLQVLAADGSVLHDSPPSPWKAGRNAPSWFTQLVAPPVATQTLVVGEGRLLIAPDTSRMVLDAWDELLNLFWLSGVLFALLNLLVFWFAGRALKENHMWQRLIQRRIEEERRRLAHELHDEVGQSLTAVKSIATSLVSRTRDSQPELAQAAQLIVDQSAQMYDAMHGMVRRLRPLLLDRLGLQAALQELVDTQQARHPQLQFRLSCSGDLARAGADVAIAAFRLVQESLTNVVRHAAATQVDIQVDAAERLHIRVQDDGRNARDPAAADTEHYGLVGMRERTEALGGHFHWQQDASGVRVDAQLPLPPAGAAA